MKKFLRPLLALALALNAGCESIDCTLNNVVLCRIGFYDSATGQAISLSDTLSVTAQGTDSVLFNRGVATSSLSLPLSYWQAADTLVLTLVSAPDTLTGASQTLQGQIILEKSNQQHFESPDCPTTMFHVISKATAAASFVDSVVVSRSEVNYLQDENIKIYFRTSASQ